MGHELLAFLVAIHIAVCKNKASFPHTHTHTIEPGTVQEEDGKL
jgi:hypothetical protein